MDHALGARELIVPEMKVVLLTDVSPEFVAQMMTTLVRIVHPIEGNATRANQVSF